MHFYPLSPITGRSHFHLVNESMKHEEDFDDEDDDDDEEDDEVKESRGAAGGGSGVSAVGTGASSGGGSLSGPLPSSSTGAAVVSSGVDAPYQPYELTLFTGGAGGGGGGTVGGVGGAPLTHGRHLPSYDIFPGAHNHSGGHFFRTTKRTQLVFPALEKTVSRPSSPTSSHESDSLVTGISYWRFQRGKACVCWGP